VTKFKATYILVIIAFLFTACRQTKHVPDGKFLVKKNTVKIYGDELDKEDVEEIIRQPANFKTLKLKLKLQAYNMVDSSRVAEKRILKNAKLDRSNDRKKARQERINERRIERARKKNLDYYTKKTIPLKDTLNPRLFIREWMKYKYGEPPVIFDSTAFIKTIEQHAYYLKKKGYYQGTNTGEVTYKHRKKLKVKYTLTTGPRLFIDSVQVEGENQSIVDKYIDYIKTEKLEKIKGEPFDRDILDDYRTTTAKTFRDDLYFGFSAANMTYVVDTNSLVENGLILTIKFTDRLVYHPDYKDSLIKIKLQPTYIRDVYFHISDTTFLSGVFKDTMQSLGLNLTEGSFFNSIDTLNYQDIYKRDKKTLDPNRMATFLYNANIFVSPGVIESQNYLEEGGKYKEYYIDRTYTRLVQLGLFLTIKPEIVEVLGTDKVDVHYYLVPGKKESFGFEPRVTTSNGYFGLTASTYYNNNNLFGGAQKLRISLTGGFESQPAVFDPTLSNDAASNLKRSFNTIEFGPSFVFDVPGLFPTKVTALSKRHRPRTVISVAYNFQKRTEYDRQTFQANYLWKMFVGKTQIFQYGLPVVSLIKFVNINPSQDFADRIAKQNDLFLLNTYSDQFIWQDWKFIFEFKNVNKDKFNPKRQAQVYYKGTFDPAGNFLSLFKSSQQLDTNGRALIFGVPYSRFVRFDNDFIMSRILTKKTSGHFRLLMGGGMPIGDKQTSLPFDYSFYGGGSNDNRGWGARTLGPGTYNVLMDTNRTLTQVADIRISSSVEYRFAIGPSLNAAVFVDAGNVWTAKEDENRPGSQFSPSWYKEINYSAGVGLRLDLDFVVVRFDLGIPLNNVGVPSTAQWIWQDRSPIWDELINEFGETTYNTLKSDGKIPSPFKPRLHFGIGYPF
jgi:outer membrane translocation and assembly module TamA